VIRFLADACLSQHIVSGCLRREPAMDFLSANAAKLEGKTDPEVLGIATREGRVLISEDTRTMPAHFGNFLQQGIMARESSWFPSRWRWEQLSKP
jgi:predicted nuclease of predicted toxin-antitoxin system